MFHVKHSGRKGAVVAHAIDTSIAIRLPSERPPEARVSFTSDEVGPSERLLHQPHRLLREFHVTHGVAGR